MAYFSNGTEGDMYEEKYCSRCIHGPNYQGQDGRLCTIWEAHMLLNYEECNKEDSVLHLLIPIGANGFADECSMFISVEALNDQQSRQSRAVSAEPEGQRPDGDFHPRVVAREGDRDAEA